MFGWTRYSLYGIVLICNSCGESYVQLYVNGQSACEFFPEDDLDSSYMGW